ncbi:terminase large subunit [Listeria booriae]|nr:terminase TerL endonuclease subunit [Listeria booriae]MBC2048215.1 terminase large subunit [Listeria booriae]MBC2263704.1 terminase large subunit [Listeria booriae]
MTQTYNTYNWHPAISEWMQMVEQEDVVSCKEQKQLMAYIRQRLKADNVVIKNDVLDTAIATAERYFYTLYPFQRFIYAFVFAVFEIDEDGDEQLMFNDYFIYAGRGFGKNGILSCMIFECTTANHGIDQYNIDIIATSEDQAKTSFEDIHNMLENNKNQMKNVYQWNLEYIKHRRNGSTIKYKTSNARTKDGGRPGAVAFDEEHAYEDYQNYTVHTSGLGKKRHPRRFHLTTDGYVRGSVLDDRKILAQAVLNGEKPNSRMLPFICKLDSDEEVNDPKNWPKANPMILYYKPLRTEIHQHWEEAQASSEVMVEFMTKRMNRPSQDPTTVAVKWDDIEATNQPFPELEKATCVGAIDFADVRDFCAVGLLFKKEGKYYFKHHTFICAESLKITKFKFPIHEAVEKGLATIIQDNYIDESYPLQWFMDHAKDYRIINIATDSFRFKSLKREFEEAGAPLTQVRSGPYSHNRLSSMVDKLFASHNIVFGDDMMMRWYCNNVAIKFDNRGEKTYIKIEPKTRKTDGFFALLHALMLDEELPESREFKLFDAYTY